MVELGSQLMRTIIRPVAPLDKELKSENKCPNTSIPAIVYPIHTIVNRIKKWFKSEIVLPNVLVINAIFGWKSRVLRRRNTNRITARLNHGQMFHNLLKEKYPFNIPLSEVNVQ
jgi:hypothetical protein